MRAQPLDVVSFAKLAMVVRRLEVGEFRLRLLEVASIHEEQHATNSTGHDEPVALGHGRPRLARCGGHLQKCARSVVVQRLLELGDRLELVRIELAALESRHRAQPRAQAGRLRIVRGRLRAVLLHPVQGRSRQPLPKRLGRVHMEEFGGCAARVQQVGDLRAGASAQVQKRERGGRRVQAVGQARSRSSPVAARPRSTSCRPSWPPVRRPPCRARTARSRRSRTPTST